MSCSEQNLPAFAQSWKFKHALSHIAYLILILSISCSPETETTINYREKNISPSDYDMLYESGNWEHPNYTNAFVSFGNHRIVIEVKDPSEAIVQVAIPWRRRDTQPEGKDVIIVSAQTDKPVQNKQVLTVNDEFGRLAFEPNRSSTKYYVYYLPHKSTGGYYPTVQYVKPEKSTTKSWLAKNNLTFDQIDRLPEANIISAQSIDDFHSFFPMEIPATQEELSTFFQKNQKPYYLFPEYRERPIIMQDYLPMHWVITEKLVNGISDDVKKGEYYTFQIGVYALAEDLNDVKVAFSDLKGKEGTIPKQKITCFNTSGINLNGEAFKKSIHVDAEKIQALWFGVEIPGDAKEGTYSGHFLIQPKGFTADTVYVQLKVTPESISNYGDNQPENMSRLRWLNSTIGTNKNFIVEPFKPVKVSDKTIHILGRDIELNAYGFPEKISSYFSQEMTKLKAEKEEVLVQPIRFDIIQEDGNSEVWNMSPFTIQQSHESEAKWETNNTSDHFTMNIAGTLEYDGMLDYKIALIAKNDTEVSDIKLQIPMAEEAAQYILGLGYKGGKRKENITWKWDVTKHQEGVWLGAINKGLQYVLRDENYERPLNTNFYQAKPLNLPFSWYNGGKGGINIKPENETVNVENYSGSREIREGDTLHFNIRFLITPFKYINLKEHFSTRFVHKYVSVDSVIALNGTVVNVHHANEINPYINYPFFNTEAQKAYIDEAHSKGIKVKLYNTIRELTYKSHELFALKSLEHEILNDGEGGGHTWLQEHFKSNYHSAWHATRVNDAAILNKGSSRWTNYYIEGINWLAKNQKIDGLYLDDIAFSRTTVKRIASVLNNHRDKYIIDLHSANQYNHRDGFINSAFLYMEHMPYVSRLWFGEYFEYDLSPDYWLTEVSGLPFGLTGEMLEKGGHPYRGMVYGITTRVYGKYNPGSLWKLFDEFDIANSEMLGYWVNRSPIKTDTEGIKSTVYLHEDTVLIAIGSWSDKDEKVSLIIDWEKLGLDKENAHLFSPEIEGLQEYNTFELNKPVLVEKNNGLMLILANGE
ncbi:MAG: hypothetical protein GY705_17585 [Bacteroidetes bacterium]|nr:hypothetical protein [Bacteroidota bacterium]